MGEIEYLTCDNFIKYLPSFFKIYKLIINGNINSQTIITLWRNFNSWVMIFFVIIYFNHY